MMEEALKAQEGFLISKLVAVVPDAINAANQRANDMEAQIPAIKECIDNRYKVIADTGIGAILLVLQASVRQFINIGGFVERTIAGDENDTVENYRRAYDRAVTAFGPFGAAAILLGYSDQYSDLDLIIRAADVPDGAKEMLIEGFHRSHGYYNQYLDGS